MTFSEKRKEFLKMMREKMPVENTGAPSQKEGDPDGMADDEAMKLIKQKFDELFGPIDDDDQEDV